MLLPRVLTAAFLVPIVVSVIWVGSIPFMLFVVAVCLLSFWEYSVMANVGGYPNQLGMGLFGSLLVLMSLFLDGAVPWGPIHRNPSPLFTLILCVPLLFAREFFRSDKSLSLLRVITSLSGIVICALLMGHLMLIRDLRLVAGEGFRQVGRQVTFFLIFVIWTVDVGAWVVGKNLGRFRIAPMISPKKSWEGAIAGTLLACLVGWMFREAFLSFAWSRGEAIIFSLIVAVMAQFSDLSESLIKRSFGVKDSSDILPGHGGVFDRFDSFIFSAPAFYYVLIATGRFQ